MIQGLLAILIQSNPASCQFRLQQCKSIFIDLNISPSFANAYVVDKFDANPREAWFPFTENLSTTDDIFPCEVTLTPQPKDTYVKDKLGFLGYSFDDKGFATPTQGTNNRVQFTPQSDVYSIQIKSGHIPQDIINKSPVRAPSHVPPHDTAATAYPNVFSHSAGSFRPHKTRSITNGNSHSMFSNCLKYKHSQTQQHVPSSNATGKFSFLNHQRQLSFQSPAVVKKSTRKQNEHPEKGDGNDENTNFDDNDDINDNTSDRTQSDQYVDIDNLSDINFAQNASAFIQELRDELSRKSAIFSKQLAGQKAH